MFNYRQTEGSTFHLRSQYQNFMLNALMVYEQGRVAKGFWGASLVRTIYEYQQLYAHRKDLQLAKEAAIFWSTFAALAPGACAGW